jgi:hypothetical protein
MGFWVECFGVFWVCFGCSGQKEERYGREGRAAKVAEDCREGGRLWGGCWGGVKMHGIDTLGVEGEAAGWGFGLSVLVCFGSSWQEEER